MSVTMSVSSPGVMSVTLKDVGDRDLWSVDIPPQPDTRRLQRVTSR